MAVGIDLQHVGEFAAAAHLREPGGCFTEEELAHGARAAAGAAASLAGIFAAKEALFKALPDRPPCFWEDVQVGHDERGRPCLRFGGTLAPWVAQRCIRAATSISHSGDYAVAMALVERAA